MPNKINILWVALAALCFIIQIKCIDTNKKIVVEIPRFKKELRLPLEMTIATFCDDELLIGENFFDCPEGTLMEGQPNWIWEEVFGPSPIDISIMCPIIPSDIICGELYEYNLIIQNCDCAKCETITTISFMKPCDCPDIIVDAGDDETICEGDDYTLGGSPTASQGTPPFNYFWSNGDNTSNPIVTPTTTTTFGVTVTDACGASEVDEIVITVSPAPVLTYNVVNDLCATSDCEGSIDLTVISSTPVYSVSWSNGSNVEDQLNLCAGSYVVNVTDGNGCVTVETINVGTEPAPDCIISGVDNTDCENANGSATVTVSGGTPGYTYLWSNGGVTPTINNLVGGQYTVEVTDANGCKCFETIDIIDDCECAPFNISATTENENCGNNNGEINVSID